MYSFLCVRACVCFSILYLYRGVGVWKGALSKGYNFLDVLYREPGNKPTFHHQVSFVHFICREGLEGL